MSKVAFERIVKKLIGHSTPDEAAVAAGSADFRTLSAVLDAALDGREYVAGTLSLADFALASHYSLADACGLDLAPFRRIQVWLGTMVARESMRKALADAEALMRSRAA
jgi:glutathione S-transferase